ncbi:hypothetical protein G4D61_02715 [Bacillus ginsengihumi]|uniref:Membrane protein n=1 Tax=Heyndrickxia ginsengihumi TaxID=363870 RepID=A0A0A6VEJ4_9BACI|nr:hypothetical protein [Heyndrickxia ginsengihumi]KHD85883.1 membrane protein [Heyndrickxia ginsengihumi]MBE6184698.1 hypothetical protein [Bacillus sp. (in: firmicutes)]MCM3023616.1 hypothetical protein [Heyndrickxia ginsengihumi]NEY18881.1 hypothetical protein [Heyndrickxia ginsengihumi]
MGIELSAIHWIYLTFIVLIILFMLFRKDTSIICVIGIFAIALVATGSLSASISGIFNSFVFAIKELLPIILVISIIVSMSKSMLDTGINDVMITPFSKLIKSPNLAFWLIGILMMIISAFFWPSPAVALMGAVLLPVALRVGLPAIGVAIAMNLFGHGIALSGDYVIQAAPKLTADGAGIPVSHVIQASIPLVIVMGVVTTITAFYLLKRDMKLGKIKVEPIIPSTSSSEQKTLLSLTYQRIFALLIPFLFILDIVAMVLFKLQGDAATSLVGGTSITILLLIMLTGYKQKGFEKTTEYLIDGLKFGFQVFGPVIPIAAFFYLGGDGFHTMIGANLPKASQGIVNDLGGALASIVPISKELGAFTVAGVGVITGLDGSGFSGISLAGSIANLFSHAIGHGVATLTALGQIAAIWVGGGTIIPWALIPAAAICNVDAFELARRNLIPVILGLIVTTIVAIFLI